MGPPKLHQTYTPVKPSHPLRPTTHSTPTNSPTSQHTTSTLSNRATKHSSCKRRPSMVAQSNSAEPHFWSTYSNNPTSPSREHPNIIPTPFTAIHTPSRHSNTTRNHNTLTGNPDRPVIRHCGNTDISTATTNGSINKRSFSMCRIVLHK